MPCGSLYTWHGPVSPEQWCHQPGDAAPDTPKELLAMCDFLDTNGIALGLLQISSQTEMENIQNLKEHHDEEAVLRGPALWHGK